MNDYLTPREVSEMAGVGYDYVLRSLRLGLLHAEKRQEGKRYRYGISQDDATPWAAARDKRSRWRTVAELAREGYRADRIAALVGCSRRTVFRTLSRPITELS